MFPTWNPNVEALGWLLLSILIITFYHHPFLGGGFNCLSFSPSFEEDFQSDEHIFQHGLVQPPTSFEFWGGFRAVFVQIEKMTQTSCEESQHLQLESWEFWTSALKALNEFGSFRVRFWVDVAWVQDRYVELFGSFFYVLRIFLRISGICLKGDVRYVFFLIVILTCKIDLYKLYAPNEPLYISTIYHILVNQMMRYKEVLTWRLLVFLVFVATASTDFVHALSQTLSLNACIGSYAMLDVRLPCHDAHFGRELCSNNT